MNLLFQEKNMKVTKLTLLMSYCLYGIVVIGND